MRTYLVESWVSGPSIIEANSKLEAENEYLHNIGYEDFNDLAQMVGWRAAIVEIEELINGTFH